MAVVTVSSIRRECISVYNCESSFIYYADMPNIGESFQCFSLQLVLDFDLVVVVDKDVCRSIEDLGDYISIAKPLALKQQEMHHPLCFLEPCLNFALTNATVWCLLPAVGVFFILNATISRLSFSKSTRLLKSMQLQIYRI